MKIKKPKAKPFKPEMTDVQLLSALLKPKKVLKKEKTKDTTTMKRDGKN